MKNNNLTNNPDIKRNLFSLRKKTKNDINKLIPSKNNQNKSISYLSKIYITLN